jgi:hypothetical protein
MLGIIQREYGIGRDEALWKYSYGEIQHLISEIPIDRIIKITGKETQSELDRKWLETIADWDGSRVVKDRELYENKVKIMELKSKIKKEKDQGKRKGLEKQLSRLQGE